MADLKSLLSFNLDDKHFVNIHINSVTLKGNTFNYFDVESRCISSVNKSRFFNVLSSLDTY